METLSKWDYRAISIYLFIPIFWDIIWRYYIEPHIIWWNIAIIATIYVLSLFTLPLILRIYSIEIEEKIVNIISDREWILSVIWITALTFEIVYVVVYVIKFLIDNNILQYVLN